jgi:hypothetical protein
MSDCSEITEGCINPVTSGKMTLSITLTLCPRIGRWHPVLEWGDVFPLVTDVDPPAVIRRPPPAASSYAPSAAA